MADDWTDEQNDAIVADYLAMLADDIAGRPCNQCRARLLRPHAILPLIKLQPDSRAIR
jgi:hypothetical protein